MEKEKQFKIYRIKEVSEMTDIPQGTIRQWEKDLDLSIPRDMENSRYYTEIEINTLKQIKEMREKNVSLKMIKELLSKHESEQDEQVHQVAQSQVQTLTKSDFISALEQFQDSVQSFTELEKTLKDTFNQIETQHKKEIDKRDELLSEVLKELKEVRKEREEAARLLEQKAEEKKSFLSKIFKRN